MNIEVIYIYIYSDYIVVNVGEHLQNKLVRLKAYVIAAIDSRSRGENVLAITKH